MAKELLNDSTIRHAKPADKDTGGLMVTSQYLQAGTSVIESPLSTIENFCPAFKCRESRISLGMTTWYCSDRVTSSMVCSLLFLMLQIYRLKI